MTTEAESQITWEDVLNTAILEASESELDPTGLNNFTDRQKEMIINEANRVVLFARWQDLTFDGRRYYATHKAMLAITIAAGQGTTSSENIGSVSVGMTMAVNNPTAEQGQLETHFGRQYYELKKIVMRRIQRVRQY